MLEINLDNLQSLKRGKSIVIILISVSVVAKLKKRGTLARLSVVQKYTQ